MTNKPPAGPSRDADVRSQAEREERWLAESIAALESWNRYVEQHGLPLARYRALMQPAVEPNVSGLPAALARGVAAKADWVRTREVIPLTAVAYAWRMSMSALDAALAGGELFAVVVDGNSYAPSEFLKLDPATVAAVCQALKGLAGIEEFVFWKRRHGALGGSTVLGALQGNTEEGLRRVIQLARGYSAEAAARR